MKSLTSLHILSVMLGVWEPTRWYFVRYCLMAELCGSSIVSLGWLLLQDHGFAEQLTIADFPSSNCATEYLGVFRNNFQSL